MVLSRNDKRKRKEGDLVDLMDPLSGSPKRTKVHAQRKFAQGAATVFSPTQTPIKEKEKVKPAAITELITHKRPNTEDFLTFLCFRGTSILPPSLNFFNVGPNKKEKQDSKPPRAPIDNTPSSSAPSTPSTEPPKITNTQKTTSKLKNCTNEKKKISNKIQKNITTYKTATSTVQALKKKYQEQRLAKQRIKNIFKTTTVMRTRSSTETVILKSANKLAPQKFLPKVETKRHCLRSSTGLADRAKCTSFPKEKPVPSKPKKRNIAKEKSSDSSDAEDTTDEEDAPLAKPTANAKRSIKTIQKKICTRSKSEMRRITRSQRDTTSSQALSGRPSRKTKEAAAVYMEILGRKLISPDLENEDNLSLDSFPELPNARKMAQTEIEIKAKVKQSTKCCVKEVRAETPSNKRVEKTKVDKPPVKSKRLMKVQKYCELESDEDSTSSVESVKARPITRRSLAKVIAKPASRSLRSSSRNIIVKTEIEINVTKSSDEKVVAKRKRDSNSGKTTPAKTTVAKQKTAKSNKNENTESEEETLGMLLDKLKKKKESSEIEEETPKKLELRNEDVPPVEPPAEKYDISKISDDEESFRGFSKKAISNVLSSCNTHVNANLLASEEVAGKLDVLKTRDTTPTNASDKSQNKMKIFSSDILSPVITVPTYTFVKPVQDKQAPSNDKTPAKSQVLSLAKPDKKSGYEFKNSAANIIDMPLSTTHGRKERVNMSTEQIEKWLNESSMVKEESKVEMESVSNFKYDGAGKVKTGATHLSIPTRIQHLVRPVNVTLSKLTEKANLKDRIALQSKLLSSLISNSQPLPPKQQGIATNRNKINADIKEIIKGRNTKASKGSFLCEDSDAISKSDHNSMDESPEKKSSPEKKPIFQSRKPFLPKVKERKGITPHANAFSPENESSVYAFESDTEAPISTPFRRKLRESNKSSTSSVVEDETSKTGDEAVKTSSETLTLGTEVSKNTNSVAKEVQGLKNTSSTATLITNKFELSKNFANLANMQVLPLDKLTTSWSNVNCSASIAVQVNLDEQSQDPQPTEKNGNPEQQKCTEISTQTEGNNDNDDDNDGQLFYIPLQSVTRNGPNLGQGQQFIQGVAVKLGTEGPNGPNQRVLLKAKLVTKPPMAVARCPPIGTVQPTTRIPPSSTSVTLVDQPVPSTSATTPAAPITHNVQKSPSRNVSHTHTTNRSSTAAGSTVGVEKLTKSPKMSRERKTSIDSAKNYKRSQSKSKHKMSELCSPSNVTTFPSAKNCNEDARLVEAPTFHPTEKDFQDPLEYIDKIRPIAEKFGICRVVPPSNFKPECKVSDDMRFTAYNQYVHRMLHRWGPNVKEMMAIKRYLATQSITLNKPPWIGGMEVDLPHLYQTVQSLGGLKEVIEKKKWQKVADGMKIPKSAQDRVTKLDDIYCKYLLPYDTLSPEEREKLFDEVEIEWKKRESKAAQNQDAQSNDEEEDEDEDSSDDTEECIVKGRNMPLNAFYRIARNTQRMWFGENQRSGNEADGASAEEVETAFWKHVAERKRHVCVHAASIDSSGRGFGFSVAKNSPFARHPWNLKVLTNNPGSVLRALGPLMGVTVPTLHVGMLFSACCWYRDPHGLPWIEYLHTGAKKIWYGIPDEHANNFREALSKMVPRYCKNKTVWLPSDTAMVPPDLLVKNGVPLCQTVQEPGQFIIVFPKAFTSSICTGYVVSESVYFAQSSWLEAAEQVFKDIQDSCEPSIFSFERLLFSIANDSRSHIDVLRLILPTVIKIRDKEINYRKQLTNLGLTNTEKLPLPDSGKGKKGKKVKEEDGDFECEVCRANLFVSLVNNGHDDSVYCLSHGFQLIVRKKHVLKNCTLMFTYSEEELDDLIHKLEDRIEAKSKKTTQIRQPK